MKKVTSKAQQALNFPSGKDKQSASEKRLFKAIDTLTGKVDCMEKRLENLATNTNRAVGNVYGEIHNLKQSKVLASSPAKPQEYVLTDADWRRVIAEGWLCEFTTSPHSTTYIGHLKRIEKTVPFPFQSDLGAGNCFQRCKPLNKPGVMQPYFGQGMPCDGKTKVLLKLKSGQHYMGKADEFGWDNAGDLRDIVAWMEIPA